MVRYNSDLFMSEQKKERQRLTIQEYFNIVKSEQRHLNEKATRLAKDYFDSLGLNISFLNFLTTYADNKNISRTEVYKIIANQELNRIVENDLMEFMAETGILIREAMLEDDVNQMQADHWGETYEPHVLKSQEESMDICVVHTVDKPESKHAKPINPFLPLIKLTNTDEMSSEDWKKWRNDKAKEVKLLTMGELLQEEDDDDSEIKSSMKLEAVNDTLDDSFSNQFKSRNNFGLTDDIVNPEFSDYRNFCD